METITLVSVNSVTSTPQVDVFVVHVTLRDETGETFDADYGSYPNDPNGVNPAIRQWLDDNLGNYTVLEPVEQAPVFKPLKPIDFQLGMLSLNITPDQIDAAIEAMQDPDRIIAKIYWTRATQFERSNELIDQLAAAFGLTSAQIDVAWQQMQSVE
jgi:hypothetical protein